MVRYSLYRHCERSVGARRHRCRCVLVRVCCCEMTTKPAVKASLARKGTRLVMGEYVLWPRQQIINNVLIFVVRYSRLSSLRAKRRNLPEGVAVSYGVPTHIDRASIIRIDFIIVLARGGLGGAIPHAGHAVREIPTLHQTLHCGFDFRSEWPKESTCTTFIIRNYFIVVVLVFAWYTWIT